MNAATDSRSAECTRVQCARVHAVADVMDQLAARAWAVTSGFAPTDHHAALAAAYMQGAAALYAADVQARALDRLAARLAPSIESLAAPSIESLAEMFGMDLDE